MGTRSGFGTGVGQEENLEKERGTMIFFEVLSRPIYKDRKGEKKLREGMPCRHVYVVSCSVSRKS